MNSKGLIRIFALMFAFALCCSGQPPPNCYSNVAVLCAGGGPNVCARAGEGPCETYENKCLVEQLNCIRYRSGEPLLTPCSKIIYSNSALDFLNTRLLIKLMKRY